MISKEKVINRLNSVSIRFVEIPFAGLLAIDPVDLAKFRSIMNDQPHYIRWLDRDYRVSKAFANFGSHGYMIHKSPLVKAGKLSMAKYAIEKVLESQGHGGNDGNHIYEGFTSDVATSAYFECFLGGHLNGSSVDRTKPIFTSKRGLELGGFAIQPRTGFSVTHPSDYSDTVQMIGGTSSKSVIAYTPDVNDSTIVNIDGFDAKGFQRYKPISDLQNWVLVTGPTALSVGEFHESGFAWIWANNSEVASVMQWELARRQGAEKIDLKNKIDDMIKTGGGVGVIRGTASINRFVLHPITRREMSTLNATTGVKEGMDFDRSKLEWESGAWLPIGGKDQTSLSVLSSLYTDTFWVISRTSETTYVFTTTQTNVSSQTIVGISSCKSFARDLGWGGAVVYEGSDTYVNGVSLTPELALISKNPGAFDEGLRGVYPTVALGDDGFIGRVAISQLMSASTDKNHPANALCNPNFTASL